jgi:hypothetical protein
MDYKELKHDVIHVLKGAHEETKGKFDRLEQGIEPPYELSEAQKEREAKATK